MSVLTKGSEHPCVMWSHMSPKWLTIHEKTVTGLKFLRFTPERAAWLQTARKHKAEADPDRRSARMITIRDPTKEPRVTAKPEGRFDARLTVEEKNCKWDTVKGRTTGLRGSRDPCCHVKKEEESTPELTGTVFLMFGYGSRERETECPKVNQLLSSFNINMPRISLGLF